MVNLYVFYVLEIALRIAALEVIGVNVSDDVKNVTPLVPLVTGKLVAHIAKPIIGPPAIIFAHSDSFIEKTDGIKSEINVPTGTEILHGFSTASPEIVRLLSI